ncbi:MAG: class I SAM-dependent methyltransferase [Pseudomonadota bacterium]
MTSEKPDLDSAYSLESPDDNRRLYRDWAATYDQEFLAESGYRYGQLIADAFSEAGGRGPVLDAGCGTGLLGAFLPADIEIDGADISAEMLAAAQRKGRYRNLYELDLTRPLPFEDSSYNGLTSSGTFTHGHVGPAALDELVRVMASDAVGAVTSHSAFYETAGFAEKFDDLVRLERITRPHMREERIYSETGQPPEGHENDMAYIIVFQRL